ncbi:glycerophosphodiester phosphodiesterase family protein [Motilimonas eburnea]|uniref:glycerophosphodiester phosphodiesterase family protein n=1 Tax=Motilimonas eburnea TaxID=1737488 RepID=UPI001E604C28|nr:glycerophosphodiester phosphodiesterase family protein [Motilimonas eburnea]MCE2572235.1 hypothetical protein [Motilimonas eburnea]
MTEKWHLPAIIGHRGVKAHAPENTLAGFSLAAEMELQWIEIDTTLCGSGECVVLHDDTLARCSNGQGQVIQHRLAELNQLDAGSWFSAQFQGEPIPSLQHALAHIDKLGLGLNLEIKTYQHSPNVMAQAVYQELQRANFSRPLLVSSFCHQTLAALHQLDPTLAIGVLFEALPRDWLTIAQSLNAISIHCDADLLSQEQAQQISTAGYPLLCYTVNHLEQAKKLWSWGVNSVFSDDPLALQVELK